MSEQYYVKIRGRVLGPLSPERLAQMAKQGQLSRIHMISEDGSSWQKAAEYPQFFQSDQQARAASNAQNSAADPEPQQAVAAEPEPQATAATASASAPSQEEWHYAVNEQSFGPVPKGTLLKLIGAGKVSKSDMVWKSGMDDWQPVSAMPEFALESEQDVRSVSSIHTGGHGSSSGSVNLTECAMTVRSTTGWVIFICVFLYFASALLFLYFIYGVVQAAKLGSSILVAQSIIALIQSVVIATAAVFLNRYASAAGKFALTTDVASLNLSARWLARFWLFLSIVLIVWLVFFVVLMIYALAIEGTL